MAWRDSRRNRGRLLLFISSIIIGIAALVGINSFSDNLQRDINRESKTLLGADLQLESTFPITDTLSWILDTLEGEQASSVNFVSMGLFPRTGDTRLVFVRAMEGAYPFYGEILTEPAGVYESYMNGQQALVDKTLMTQYELKPGDLIKLGSLEFEIAGQLLSTPGRAGISSSVAPLVLIPMQYLETTGLVQKGSRVEYNYFFKFAPDFDVEAITQNMRPSLQAASIGYDTVKERKEDVGETFSNLAIFLNLVSFVALLLGCIGVASSVHIYIKDKVATVAILRTLGASGRQAFQIYLVQIAVMGLIGAISGALLGTILQYFLPELFRDFLPIDKVSRELSWISVVQGVVTGLCIAILFALLPLIGIRKVSPLKAIRASFEDENQGPDPLRWVIFGGIFLFVFGFSWFQMRGGMQAIFFPIAIGIGFLILVGLARLVMWLVKRFFPTGWSYIWRQSLANLYRPNNQTLILLVSIGLGTTLIATLFFTRDLLLDQVELTGRGDRPNMILFDIQTPQKEEVADLARSHDLPLIQQVPIVTMRLDNIDGVTKTMRLADSTSNVSRWVYNREYRITYRDTLIDSETLTEGEWHGDKTDDGKIYISIAENIADDMEATVGTKIAFNVQGAMIETEVSSIREVDFQRVQTNFLVVFPTGVLEKAPQFHVVVTRTDNEDQSALFQRELIKAFPNVSVIDLTQILRSVDEVLGKVSFVIQFMALFSILTGLLVLLSSVIISKYQRIKESVLLRTIGASRRQILRINALEYFMLGGLAALTGILLSVGASWALAAFQFKIPYEPNWLPVLIAFVIITILTVLIGMFNTREVVNRPPLEVLREEV